MKILEQILKNFENLIKYGFFNPYNLPPSIPKNGLWEILQQTGFALITIITSQNQILSIPGVIIAIGWGLVSNVDFKQSINDIEKILDLNNYVRRITTLAFFIVELIIGIQLYPSLIIIGAPWLFAIILTFIWIVGGALRLILEAFQVTRLSLGGFIGIARIFGRMKLFYFIAIFFILTVKGSWIDVIVLSVIFLVFYRAILVYADGTSLTLNRTYNLLKILSENDGLGLEETSNKLGATHEDTKERLEALIPKYIEKINRRYYLSDRSIIMQT